MSGFGITARFPTGTYRGHTDGALDSWPCTTRLYDALTHAAGTGSTAVLSGGDLTPSAEARAALAWLEENAPDHLHLPPTLTSHQEPGRGRPADISVWRAEGVLEKKSKALVDRKTLRSLGSTSMNGPMGWIWDEAPPDDVRVALEALVADVAYLGEAESPVILELVALEPTHDKIDATAFTPLVDGLRMLTPIVGRFDALEELYATRYPAKRPTPARDKFTENQTPISPPPPVTVATSVAYVPVDRQERQPSPWRHVHLLPLVTDDGEPTDIAPRERVAWAVAAHRAIVAQPSLAFTPSPLVTGRYPSSRGDSDAMPRKHANRVAIQLLSPSMADLRGDLREHTHLAVMVPGDADDHEQGLIAAALSELTSVYAGRLGKLRIGDERRRVDAGTFWRPPAPGSRRLWRSSPVIVPEIPSLKNADGRRWSLEESGLLSVGFVLRDRPELRDSPRGVEGYRRIREVMREQGVRVLGAAPERDHPADFVHKLPRGVVAQPYRAWVDLAEVVSNRALMAIGQTRHLGGGLLRPVDLPDDVADEWLGGL